MDYKVTLAMPVYNVEKYVERALLSALNQTFSSIEFLIVDDKGTDGSMDIVRKIAAIHPRGKDIRIIDHKVNQGTGSTKNSAIREAKGDYLFFMDSDDEIVPDTIQILHDNMIASTADFVAASYTIYNESGEVLKEFILPRTDLKGHFVLAHYYYDQNKPFFVATWNKLYRTSFLRQHNIHCISYHVSEDQLFSFQMALNTTSFVLLSDVTYKYILRNNSTMDEEWTIGLTSKTARQYQDIFDFKKKAIFGEKAFDEYGYLFVNELFESILSRIILLIRSSRLSLKEKFHYICNYCETKRITKSRIRLKNRRTAFFYSLIKFSDWEPYKVFIVYCYFYCIILKYKITRSGQHGYRWSGSL